MTFWQFLRERNTQVMLGILLWGQSASWAIAFGDTLMAFVSLCGVMAFGFYGTMRR